MGKKRSKGSDGRRDGQRTAGESALAAALSPSDAARVQVRRTPKLYIGGAFPRSESGRTDLLQRARGEIGSAPV